MNILDKFEIFEVKQKDKISKEDKENCEKIQAIYEKTLSVYKKWYDIYHENVKSELSFFEYGKETEFAELSSLKRRYDIKWSDIESNIKINSQKIKSIKLFKNGRVDIKFSSSKIARKFAENWCGYTLSDAPTRSELNYAKTDKIY